VQSTIARGWKGAWKKRVKKQVRVFSGASAPNLPWGDGLEGKDGFFLDLMRAIAIVEEGIGMGTGMGWLLCFAAAGFLSWALYQSFVVHRGRSAKPQNPDAAAPCSGPASQSPLLADREMKVFLDTDRFDPPAIASTLEPVVIPRPIVRHKHPLGRSLRWRPPGEMIQLRSGHRIDGMIYTATGLVRGADEPSAINDGWQVASSPQPYQRPLDPGQVTTH
jgi:hypothetical protein